MNHSGVITGRCSCEKFIYQVEGEQSVSIKLVLTNLAFYAVYLSIIVEK